MTHILIQNTGKYTGSETGKGISPPDDKLGIGFVGREVLQSRGPFLGPRGIKRLHMRLIVPVTPLQVNGEKYVGCSGHVYLFIFIRVFATVLSEFYFTTAQHS